MLKKVDMKRFLGYLLLLFFILSCDQQPKKKGAVKSKTLFDWVYRDIKEVPYFKGYERATACVIDRDNRTSEYAFVEMMKGNRRIVVLEKIIDTGKPKKKYQILDTIHINGFGKDDFLMLCQCVENGKANAQILTKTTRIKEAYDLEYYSSFHRAWKANLETEKIEEMKKLEGIRCANESFGI